MRTSKRRRRVLRGRRVRGVDRSPPARRADDLTGDELFTLRARDLTTGEDLPDRIEGSPGSAWAGDHRTFFYVKPDDAMRPFQVWRHVLGTAVDDDVCVFTEDDERFFASTWAATRTTPSSTSVCRRRSPTRPGVARRRSTRRTPNRHTSP
ncbi:MAG: hypothetical protein R2710_17740 [Acidimicrobiales bacterium]